MTYRNIYFFLLMKAELINNRSKENVNINFDFFADFQQDQHN